MRKLLAFALILVFVPLGLSAVSYDIQVKEDTTYFNTTIEFTADEDVTVWNGKWGVPEGAEILSIEDSRGTIEEYEVIGEKVEFKTNSGPPRQREVVEISYRAPAEIEKWEDIKRFSISLPGVSDEDTSIQVEVPEPILGTSERRGFKSSFRANTATFQGKGPVNIKVSYTGEKGEYDHYILEGDVNLSASDNYYPILKSFTGVKPDFRKFAVIVMSDEVYEEEIEKWSAGSYKSPALIFVKNSSTAKDKLTGLMLHETMHGFNQKPLNWVNVKASLFDEGTSKFIETYVNDKMGLRQAEIFGDVKTWEAACDEKSSRRCRFTLQPRSTPEDLESYYDSGQDFMNTWSPGSSVDRTFGYAYAELLIREYLKDNGATALREVYQKMEDMKIADTRDGYVSNLKEALGTDLEPCHPMKEEEFLDCLEESREYSPDVPQNVQIDGTNESIEFKTINRSKKSTQPEGISEGGGFQLETQEIERKTDSFFRGFGIWVLRQFEKLINLFR